MSIGRVPGVTGIQPSIVDAKGDLIVATAADSVDRLAVGTNEQRLVADSAAATGLKYVADTTNYAIAAKGDLLVGTAADTLAALSVGTNGHTLVADSSTATGLKWAAPASGSTFVGCVLNKSAVQSIAHDSEAIVSYDQETFDTDGFHSNTTNNTRITIPTGKGGYYLFYGNYHFAANATGVRMGYFIKNGTGGAIQGSQTLLGATPSNVFITNNAIILNLTAGDYLEMAVQQTSGGNLNLNTTHTVFGCTYLGA